MTRGSPGRSEIASRALDAGPSGGGLRSVTVVLLRLGTALVLGLSFLLTQVADAAGAEPPEGLAVEASAGEPVLEETPEPPPETEPPAPLPPEPTPAPTDPPEVEPAPAPPEVEPTPAPTDPPEVEPTPAPEPLEVEPSPAPTDPPEAEPTPAPTDPVATVPSEPIPAPAEPTEPLPVAQEDELPPEAPIADAPSPDADGSPRPGVRDPRMYGPLERAGIAPEQGETTHPVAAVRTQPSRPAAVPKSPGPNRERSAPPVANAPDALVLDHPSRSRLQRDGCGVGRLEGCAEVVSASAASVIVIATPRIPNTVSVAVEFGKAGHGWAGAIVFNLWLRRQLRERRMSQRQLAHLSGVDHSTISRLIAGDRTPSLDTAAKLARALHVSTDEIGTELGFVDGGPILPTQRVEAALRGDDDLDDADVRALMEEYIARRRRPRLKAVDARAPARGSPRAAGPDPPA